MKKQIVIAGLSLLLISGCVADKRDLSEMSQTVEATQDIHTAPELGTAVSGDALLAVDNDDAAGSRLSRIVLDGVATNCLSGAGTLVPCGGDLVNDTTPQLGGNLDIQTFNIEGVDATEFGYLEGVTSDIQTQFDLKAPLASPNLTGTLFIAEQADAAADVAGSGQIWVNLATPNELWFTDDAGTDVQLGTGSGSGDLLANGTIPMTADWPFGAFDITGGVDSTWSGQGSFGTLTSGAAGMTVDADGDTVVKSLTTVGEVQGGSFSSPASASGPQYTLFYEDSDNGSNYIGIASQTANGNDLIWSFPTADPTAGQIMSWAAPVSVTYPNYPGTVSIDTTVGSWIDPDFLSLAVADLGDTATPHVLTAAETTNKAISNYAASGADRVFTMAVPHAKGNIIFPIGDEFQVDIEPSSGQFFYRNGTAMAADEHIQNTADTLGERIVGYCVNINGTLRWMFYSSDAAWVEETP